MKFALFVVVWSITPQSVSLVKEYISAINLTYDQCYKKHEEVFRSNIDGDSIFKGAYCIRQETP